MKRVLISIKPKYVDEIINNRKLYEFRKSIFKEKSISRVYIYSTKPVGKIVGYFEIDEILSDTPEKIWNICSKDGGIEEAEFFKYFEGKDKAYAIKMKNIVIFERWIVATQKEFTIPQSFRYLDKEELNLI